MAFKLFKKLTAAVLATATAVTASITAFGNSGSLYADNTDRIELFSDSSILSEQFGCVSNVREQIFVPYGLIGRFEGTKYYDQLDSDSQVLYDFLYNQYKDGMKNGTDIDILDYLSETEFEVTGTTNGNQFILDEVSRALINDSITECVYPAYLALSADHPELSWISSCQFFLRTNANGIQSIGNGKYKYPLTNVFFSLYTENIYGTPTEMNSAIDSAKNAVGIKDSRYEQVKAIHDYLCDTIDYNFTAAGGSVPDGYDTGFYQTAYSAFYKIPQDGNTSDKNLTVCAGYARSFKALCDSFNIPCIYVSGSGINAQGGREAHAWNYVRMADDKWYAVDVTWDDQVQKIYYEYFLAGSNTPGFNNKTFNESHSASGAWYENAEYIFQYPDLAEEAFDPEAEPVVTTPDETDKPATTPEESDKPVTSPEESDKPDTTPEESDKPVTTPEESDTPEQTFSPEQLDNIKTEIKQGDDSLKAEIPMDKSQIINAALSDEEKEILKKEVISIELSIDNADKTVSEEDKIAIEKLLEDIRNEQGDFKTGIFLDISLFKTINESRNKITETQSMITVKLSIPESIKKDGRIFAAARIHNGTVELLKDMDDNPDTISFETDRFSTYAIVYSDPETSAPVTTPSKGDNDDIDKPVSTGVSFDNPLILIVIIGAGAILFSAFSVYIKFTGSKNKK